jgi:hypothetical protein
MVNTPLPDESYRKVSKEYATALRARLLAGKSDDSIGVLYLEMALAARSDVGFKRVGEGWGMTGR